MSAIVRIIFPIAAYAVFLVVAFLHPQWQMINIFYLVWFFAVVSSLVFYARKRDKLSSFLAVFQVGLLIAGAAEALQMRWFHIAYLPYVVLISAFSRASVLFWSVVSVVLFEVKHLLTRDTFSEEIALLSAVAMTGTLSYLLLSRVRKEKERLLRSLRSLKDAALETLDSEGYLERGISLGLEADAEINDVLFAAKTSLRPDSVSLFVPQAGRLTLRKTTEPSGLSISDKGLIHIAFQRRETIVINNKEMKHFNAGYTKPSAITSIVAVPVMDQGFCLGVLAADSAASGAFSEKDVSALQQFARIVAAILKKQKIFAETERSHLGLKLLHEGSSRLVSSLRLNAVSETFLSDASRIIQPKDGEFSVALFLNSTEGLECVKATGLSIPNKRIHSAKGTLLEVALKGKEHLYIPDLEGYSIPPLPFNSGRPLSAFYLPLVYEQEIIGVLAALFPRANPLSAHQIELLEVFGNIASSAFKNAVLHSRIEKMAFTDGLTGLYNHREFQERLSAELKRQQRYRHPLSLLLIDLDFFKKINDTYGHPAGDAVLRAAADIIRTTVREVDLPARYGGEEFAALLIDTDKNGALQTAERLRGLIEKANFRAEGSRIRVTVSIGVAAVPTDAETKEDLIERADKALYHAKAEGRNRVVGWSRELPSTMPKKTKK